MSECRIERRYEFFIIYYILSPTLSLLNSITLAHFDTRDYVKSPYDISFLSHTTQPSDGNGSRLNLLPYRDVSRRTQRKATEFPNPH